MTLPAVRLICLTSWLPLLGALTAPFGLLAEPNPGLISSAGTQLDVGESWRSGAVSKALDLDGDDTFGTDGYLLVNLPPVQPAYVASTDVLTGNYPGNEAYAVLDNPTDPGTKFLTGTQNPVPGVGQSADLFQFTLNSQAVGRLIRVGLLVDNLDDSSFNAAGLELVQTAGGTASSGLVATTAPVFNNRVPDWIFFEIVGGKPGDSFVVRGQGGPNGYATLGGVAFDSLGAIGGRLRSNSFRPAFPYPSRLFISDAGPNPSQVILVLNELSAGFQGLGLLLVGPGGQKIRPLAFAFGAFDVNQGVTLTFDDAAPSDLPVLSEGVIPSGTYRPQSEQGDQGDLPPPAPPGPYTSRLNSALAGPLNGVWSLYAAGTPLSIKSWGLSFSRYSIRNPISFAGGGISSGGEFTVSGTAGEFGTTSPMTGGEGLSLTSPVWALPTLVQTPGAPPLQIRKTSPGFVTLSWSTEPAGFVLQSTENLALAHWTTVPTEGINPISLPVSSTIRAYRLFKP